MRTMITQQPPLMQAPIDHEHAWELGEISDILDSTPQVLAAIERDLREGRRSDVGRPGMTAEQVLRALVVKQMNGYSYDQLAFHLADSATYRTFCRIGSFERPPSKSTLQENIKRLQAETLQAIHRVVLRLAYESGVEDGKTVRGDCTVVETNIHAPRDSMQLWDSVRVLVRWLKRAREACGIQFTNHGRRAKRRALGIGQTGSPTKREKLYRDLLRVTESTVADAEKAASILDNRRSPGACAVAAELRRVSAIARRVIDQTQRRVLGGEIVPAEEKVYSIFELHTDLIIKKKGEAEYGHKICLTSGVSSLVLDCVILEGNPADSTLAVGMIQRHRSLYGEVPSEVVFDGGFASRENLEELKAMGVGEVAFSKHRGLELNEMVSSSWLLKWLRNFRAGIESGISFLKRCFGLSRCLWRGFASFKAYVWGSILSANLLSLARHRMAAAT
jgi:IS5 family transposase